jgi:hypothetical protein
LAHALDSSINPLPLSFVVEAEEVTDDLYARNITVKAVYDNSPSASFFDIDIEANKDFKTDSVQLNVKGVIQGSGRHVRRKFQSALDFFNSTIGGKNGVRGYLYALAQSGANALGYTNSINTTPQSISVVANSGQGLISINGTFTDALYVSGFVNFAWDVSCDCGLNIFKPFESVNKNGYYIIQDLNIINRSNVNINGNFAYPNGFSPSLAAPILNSLKNLEGTTNGFLESLSYNINSGEVLTSGFNCSYTKEGNSLASLPVDGKIYQ